MPHIYSKVDTLQGEDMVGSKQCVALLQHYAKLDHTSMWKEGKTVLGTFTIAKGTAIATFVDGRYKSRPTGNHAAFYISQDAGGIWIMDQWANDQKKKTVSKRYIMRMGKLQNGQYVTPSDNADAYSVIE